MDVDDQVIDVTNHDEFRNVLDIKYSVRHVPVIDLGVNDQYQDVMEVGIEHLQEALEKVNKVIQ